MPSFDPHRMMSPVTEVAEILLNESHAPAVVIEIERGGRSAGFASGVADIAGGDAATLDQTFEIGSQTKMMTATLVLQLADRGGIDLDAPISDYLGASVLDGLANADRATVRELLSMTSGIPNYTDATGDSGLPVFAERLMAGQSFGPRDALDVARAMTAGGQPGGHYEYSNTNYVLLGMMLEKVTGKPLPDLFERNIFKPLGMDQTTARPFSSDDPRLSSYALFGEDEQMIDVTHVPWHQKGEAGVVSTTGDMIDFLRALIKPGELFSAEARRAMMDFHVSERGEGYVISFGLGLAKIRLDTGESFIGFTGGTLGTSSSTYVSMKTGAAVAIAGTAPDLLSEAGAVSLALMLKKSSAWDPALEQGPGPLTVKDASAAGTLVEIDGRFSRIDVDGAEASISRPLHALRPGDFAFDDGSLLIVGDGRRGGNDHGANDIDILRDQPSADGKDNHVLGLGGDDRIVGGAGNERLEGNRGNDELFGGAGNDVVDGGAGSDRMTGGAGADTFLFHAATDSRAGAGRDVILDFESAVDRLDLTAIDAVPGGRDDALRWLGSDAFDGAAGALRVELDGADITILVDIDGDRSADMEIRLDGTTSVVRGDFLL